MYNGPLSNNRLIVTYPETIDLAERFKMIMEDGYSINPPEPKLHIVDIPGGNGSIDVTESLTGDIAYNDRDQEFTFYILEVDDFEKLRSDLLRTIHGKKFKYKMTMDPDYTYTGRFVINSVKKTLYSDGIYATVSLKITAEPYKHLKNMLYEINTLGGNWFSFESGRKKVRPTITVNADTMLIRDGDTNVISLEPGTHDIRKIELKSGNNSVFIASGLKPTLKWVDLADEYFFRDFIVEPIYAIYKTHNDYIIPMTWEDTVTDRRTWEDWSSTTWGDLKKSIDPEETVDGNAVITYEWSDL